MISSVVWGTYVPKDEAGEETIEPMSFRLIITDLQTYGRYIDLEDSV